MTVDTYAEQDEAFADEVRAALYEELERHGITPEALRANMPERKHVFEDGMCKTCGY